MPTKNLVPRQDGEGKLGVKSTELTLKWKEINAVSGSLDVVSLDELNNQEGNSLLVGGSGVNISRADSGSGFQYTISATSTGAPDFIQEGQAKVETVDNGTDGRIDFYTEISNDTTTFPSPTYTTPVPVWKIDESGNIIPGKNDQFDIGEAENKVRHLFLSDSSLHIGSTSSSDTSLQYKLGKDSDHKVTWKIGNNAAEALSTESFVTSQGYATQSYVNEQIQGLDVKGSVKVATNNTMTSLGYTYANSTTQEWQEDAPYTGALTIDGITLSNGDRVLVKSETTAKSKQGIFVVSGIGSGTQVILDRASDLENGSDFAGSFTFVEEGSESGKGFVAKNTSSPENTTVGAHVLEWVQFSSVGSTLSSLTDTNITNITGHQYIKWDTSNNIWINDHIQHSHITGVPDYLLNISEDSTPQLGANLDVNGNDIVSVSNGDIEFAAHGTGTVKITPTTSGGHLVLQGDGTTSGKIVLNCESNTHGITLKGPPHSAGASYTLTLPDDVGTSSQVLQTDGSGNLSWVSQSGGGISNVLEDTTPQLGGDLDVLDRTIKSTATDGNINLEPQASGHVLIGKNGDKSSPPEIRFYSESGAASGNFVGLKGPTDGKISTDVTFELPFADGSAGQVLETDGNGILSWTTISSGSSASRPAVSTINAAGTVPAPSSSDVLETIHLINPTTAIVLELPDISATSSLGNGFKYQLKNISSHNITIRPASGDSIDTLTTDRTLNQYDSFTLVVGSNTDWYII